MRHIGGAVGAVVVLMVGVAACGGDGDSTSSAQVAETLTPSIDATSTDSTSADVASAEESSGSARAQVVLNGATHDFTDGSCAVTAGGDVVSQFSDGDDALNVTLVNRSGLIRATLGGELWVDTGDVGEPEVADAGTVTWSGELQKENVADSVTDATITLSC